MPVCQVEDGMPVEPDHVHFIRPGHAPGEHEFFAGYALLMELRRETPGIVPVMARQAGPMTAAICGPSATHLPPIYLGTGSGS
jgi:hypothetical protein